MKEKHDNEALDREASLLAQKMELERQRDIIERARENCESQPVELQAKEEAAMREDQILQAKQAKLLASLQNKGHQTRKMKE